MFNESYNDWNHKRAKAIIDHFGFRFFSGKRILDLGSGPGDIAASFARLGASVLCVDARQENLDIIAKKFPFIKTARIDLDTEWPFLPNQFDIVLSLGLLCHLKNYDRHLLNICSAAENIILETEVLDSQDPNVRIPLYEEKSINDLSFNGEGSIVSAINIQNRLSELGATFRRIDDSKINSGQHRYNWREENSGRKYGNRRFWFIRRNSFIAQKLLNQEQVKKAENEARGLFENSTNQPHNIVNYITPPQVSAGKLKNTALCLFGNSENNTSYDSINREICNVFLYTNDKATVDLIKPDKYLIEERNSNFSDVENFFYNLKKVNSIKETQERELLDIYQRVVVADVSAPLSFDNISNVMGDALLISGSKLFISSSIVSDIYAEIFNYLSKYSDVIKTNSISDFINYHMKEFGIQIIIIQ